MHSHHEATSAASLANQIDLHLLALGRVTPVSNPNADSVSYGLQDLVMTAVLVPHAQCF